jgi:hypothetical protein
VSAVSKDGEASSGEQWADPIIISLGDGAAEAQPRQFMQPPSEHQTAFASDPELPNQECVSRGFQKPSIITVSFGCGQGVCELKRIDGRFDVVPPEAGHKAAHRREVDTAGDVAVC